MSHSYDVIERDESFVYSDDWLNSSEPSSTEVYSGSGFPNLQNKVEMMNGGSHRNHFDQQKRYNDGRIGLKAVLVIISLVAIT